MLFILFLWYTKKGGINLQETFEEYMDKNIVSWKTDLTLEQINDIKESYNKVQKTTDEQIDVKNELEAKIELYKGYITSLESVDDQDHIIR